MSLVKTDSLLFIVVCIIHHKESDDIKFIAGYDHEGDAREHIQTIFGENVVGEDKQGEIVDNEVHTHDGNNHITYKIKKVSKWITKS